MIFILRQIMRSIFVCLVITIITSGIIFFVFPLENWNDLITQKAGDVPFFVIIAAIPVLTGSIAGLIQAGYWRERLHFLDKRLDELVKGQKAAIPEDAPAYKDLETVQLQIQKLRTKFREQAEYAQHLTTERTTEREKSLQEIVVQERNRLARELHDSVSQQLFAASMMMAAINEANEIEDQTSKKQLSMVEQMINQSQLEMRALLLHLRPVALKGKSLQEGTEELLTELTQKVPMEVNWKIEEFTAAKGIEDQLFRILQESVSNTLRHAKANALHVLLIERDDLIILRVTDDGIGFNADETKTSSYGLDNMRERAYDVGGSFKIISLPNKGTRLEVKVPQLREKDESND